MTKQLFQRIASAMQARENCQQSGNIEWFGRHGQTIMALVENYMPSGSGFDNGVIFDFDESKTDRLVFNTAFHHMDDGGMYDGWTDHSVIVTPSLAFGFNLRITGRDRNEIKDYIAEVFQSALSEELTDDTFAKLAA